MRLFVRSLCNAGDKGARTGDSGRLLCVVSVWAPAILAEALQEFFSECRAAAPADSRSSKALIFELGAASHCRADRRLLAIPFVSGALAGAGHAQLAFLFLSRVAELDRALNGTGWRDDFVRARHAPARTRLHAPHLQPNPTYS